jgi:hypothetical protein
MRLAGPAILAMLALAACSDANSIPDATFSNVIDTVVVYAISGTEGVPAERILDDPAKPGADRQHHFGGLWLRPHAGRTRCSPSGRDDGSPGASGVDPGLQHTDLAFDEITLAESDNYKDARHRGRGRG